MADKLTDIINLDTQSGRDGLIAIISQQAANGNEDALKAMDHVQEIATEKWADLSPEIQNSCEKAFNALKKK